MLRLDLEKFALGFIMKRKDEDGKEIIKELNGDNGTVCEEVAR
jgi:hypothetical protein